MTLSSIAPLQNTQQPTALNTGSDRESKNTRPLQSGQQGNDDTATFSAKGRYYAEQNLESHSAEPKFTYSNTSDNDSLKTNGKVPKEVLNLRMPDWYAKVVTPEFAILEPSLGQKFDPEHQRLMDSTRQERKELSTSMREKLGQAMSETGVEQLSEIYSSSEKNEELKTAFYKLVDEDERSKELFETLGINI
ncbi:hypothetical protein [Marinospirillum sp.]|uniref:hypothetical protein n=1 Tax=Marinospirillum sp. TaxID=2183934 RepID=UPI00384C6082